MFEIQTEADGVLRILAETEARTRNWRPALNEAALFLEGEVKNNFLKQQDPDGKPWEPLAESTLKSKLRRRAPRDILRDTSTLASGIAARPASDNQVSVETTAGAEYGLWHQLGVKPHTRARTQFFRGSYRYTHPGMPQRRYMGFSQRYIDRVQEILLRYLEQ